jgi:transcription initiation factor IIE alpha subunit
MHWFSIMSEPNTICSACRIKISQRTAAEHDGLCDLCHHKVTNTPPNNIEIARDFAEHFFR